MSDFEALLQAWASEFNQELSSFLPQEEGVVCDAMRYSLEGGGKRIRPILVRAFCENFGGNSKISSMFSVSLEMMHTYSLIHDDLPCMDNDDFRRGRLSCHRKFGEAIAVLAGDALLTQAFAVMAEAAEVSPQQRCEAMMLLAAAAGVQGMIGGQELDFMYERKRATRRQLEEMNRKKTGALIQLACRLGCLAAGAGQDETAAAMRYADALGLLFQVTDDILDVEGKMSKTGKTVGKDEYAGKSTWVALLGLRQAKEQAMKLATLAQQAIASLAPPDSPLFCLPGWLVGREL